jgi:hypothetical protein
MENLIHGKAEAALSMCGCGRLHFTYGPITLHFDREEFARFVHEVSRLARTLDQLADRHGPALAANRDITLCH